MARNSFNYGFTITIYCERCKTNLRRTATTMADAQRMLRNHDYEHTTEAEAARATVTPAAGPGGRP